ncbi:TetR/AcrR family transcriptional regulator [Actinomadura sp. 9N215]|uniref:TetR/AcrR family transcriptional regulator n=1 Tax=Actinomadura sp. 9N215 TaxID=3375150 RepID=UPI00378D5204
MTQASHPSPRRPRSQRSFDAVLTTAAQLLAERGLAALTMDEVARRAVVSKATIYRWWPSKGALALEVLLRADTPDTAPPDTGDVHTDLATHLRLVLARFRDSDDGRAIADLTAEAQRDPSVSAALRDRWLATRRAAGKQRLRTAQRAGQLRDDIDLDALLDTLYGPIYFRLLSGHAPLTDELADQLTDIALTGATPREHKRSRPQ